MSTADTLRLQVANPDTLKQILRTPGVDANIAAVAQNPDNERKLDNATAPNWVTGTVYAAGAIVLPTSGNTGGFYFRTAGGGTSGDSEPSPWSQSVGGVSTDGTIADWTNIGAYPIWY